MYIFGFCITVVGPLPEATVIQNVQTQSQLLTIHLEWNSVESYCHSSTSIFDGEIFLV